MLDPATDSQLKEIISSMVSPEQKKPHKEFFAEKPKFKLDLEAVKNAAEKEQKPKE